MKWEIRYKPRNETDSRPWVMLCPNQPSEMSFWEQTGFCQCRRFKNGRKAISFFNRRVSGNRIIKQKRNEIEPCS